MFGPVTRRSDWELPVSIKVSLGIKFFCPLIVTQGWTICLISMNYLWSSSLNIGRHMGTSDWPLTIAREAKQSNSVRTAKHCSHIVLCEWNFEKIAVKNGAIESFNASSAFSNFSTSSFVYGVINLGYPWREELNSKSFGFLFPSTCSSGISIE